MFLKIIGIIGIIIVIIIAYVIWKIASSAFFKPRGTEIVFYHDPNTQLIFDSFSDIYLKKTERIQRYNGIETTEHTRLLQKDKANIFKALESLFVRNAKCDTGLPAEASYKIEIFPQTGNPATINLNSLECLNDNEKSGVMQAINLLKTV